MAPSIAIIAHENDDFIKRSSFLREIARLWQDDGLDVGLYIKPSPQAKADVAILHVNLSVVPSEYLDFAQNFPVTLNGRVKDISKRAISFNILQRHANYEGAVMVKANENYGGEPEQRLEKSIGITSKYRRLTTWEYYVLDSLDRVTEEVWSNPHLVVEKFLPEKEGEFFILRHWYFLGDTEFHRKIYSINPLVKGEGVIRREPITEPIPEELRERRRQLGFDFGKFDYALVDGKLVVYDVNKTPGLGAVLAPEHARLQLPILKTGIYQYFTK
ncbi:MAG TPA: hypothetical protein V6C81_32220 [Planktothrix sp.]|jgi:hypothetical protein